MKEHTIIFVPHARAKFRKWRLTSLQAGLILGSLAFLTVGGVAATILYFQTAFDRQELDSIQAENAVLRQTNESFEVWIREIEGELEQKEKEIQQLAIVAGVEELAATGEAGLGGPVLLEEGLLNAQDVDMEDRLAFIEDQVEGLGSSIGVLQERFDERRLLISSTPAVTPVKGLLTSRFGYRADPITKRRAFHNGVDIVAPRGKEVRATGDGIVTRTGRVQGLGNAVYVSHGFGLTTRYGHLLKITVAEGQKVRRGDVVGLVGNTGRSTGYHLHYEVRQDGKGVDPLGYILDGTAP